jgi:multidrug transporter EmrE-like cation transporter
MGFLQMANWSLLMIGLQGIGGSVAYSLNGVVGLVCVYGISFSFFKEHVSPIEKIGILVSIIAILLMTASLYANAP